jgi:hypothetical protein
MRFAGLTPMSLVELFRTSPAGHRQRIPLFPGVDSGNLNDLADVVAGVAQDRCGLVWHGWTCWRTPLLGFYAKNRHEKSGIE